MSISASENNQTSIESILEPIQKPLGSIENRFKEYVRSDNPAIQEMVDYVFVKSGKKLRPSLVFITSMIWDSKNYDEIIDLALSIELIHIATLVHDDVNDFSELRRGIETYNKKWGNTASVLFGDFLFARAFVILSKLGNLKIIQNLSKTTSEICEGEIMQSLLKDEYEISVDKYLKIIRYKTASLIGESCRVGAVIAGMGEEVENVLYRFGVNIGMAFQIYDDYLDFYGDQKSLGKPVFNDIQNGYITLPVIHLLSQVANGKKDVFISKIKSQKDLNDLDGIKKMLDEHNSLKYTLDTANDYIRKANKELTDLKNETLKDYLSKASQFIVNRRF